MKKNILVLLIASVLISLVVYLKIFKKETFKEEVVVETTSYSSSNVKINNKTLEIHSNLFDKGKKIVVEGTKKKGKYIINKIHMNFASEKEKENFTLNKLHDNPFIKSFSNVLEFDSENTIFAIIPLRLSNQEYVDMLSSKEVYNFITKHYAPPIGAIDKEEIVIKNKNEINVIEVNYHEKEDIKKVDFTKNDEFISFKRVENGYYSIKVEVNLDLLEFIIM